MDGLPFSSERRQDVGHDDRRARIASPDSVLGVGNIGSTFAFQLARIGGHDVTVVARPGSKRLEQLRRDRAIVDVKGERARVHVTDTLDELAPFDVVIVTLLAHQVDAVLPALRRSAAGCVQFMFNTFDRSACATPLEPSAARSA